MKRILIIGISGYTGYYLAKLAAKSYEVFGTYNTRPIVISGCETQQLEKTKDYQVQQLISDIKPDVVIDCAALHNADYCEENSDLAYRTNYSGSMNIARNCRFNNAKLIFVSTDYVFDGHKNYAYKETDLPNAINTYGKSKLLAERGIPKLMKNYIIARPSDIFGWRPPNLNNRESSSKKNKSFAEWVMENLRKGKELTLFTDQYNNSTYVCSLAKMLLELAESNLTGIFHTSGLTCQNRYDQGLTIAKIFKLNSKLIKPINSDIFKQKAQRPKKLCLNTEKVRGLLKTRPLPIESAILEMLADEI